MGRLVTQHLDVKSVIWLYLGPSEHQRGQILGHLTEPVKCCALREVEQATGRTFDRVCMVLNAAVMDSRLLGQGYGVQLYVDLAKRAAEQFDAPILSSTAWGHEISDDAMRVWNSRRLAEALVVRGRCAWPKQEES